MKLKPAASLLALLFTILLTCVGCLGNSEHYRGEEKNGVPHGRGVWLHRGGARYIGHFKEGQRHGTGTWIHPSGAYYMGCWEDGEYHGTGMLTYADGACYTGQWVENKKHGFGMYTWADGRSYQGLWVENEMHGFGYLYYPDGSRHRGFWENSLANGRGIRVRPDGSTEKGSWLNGQFLIVPLESLALSRERVTLTRNGPPITLEAIFTPPEATTPELNWESSHPRIAAVENGVVTPLSPGQAVITVTTLDGLFEAFCTVMVQETVIAVTGVRLNYQTLTLTAGGAAQVLIATIIPGSATNKVVTWSSGNPDVAAVSFLGTVTPLAPGETLITVTTLDGRWTDTCLVIVNPVPAPPPPPPPDDGGDEPGGEEDNP